MIFAIKSFCRKYSYFIFPILSLVIISVLIKIQIFTIDKDFNNNLISISSTLVGFLFTAFVFFITLPENRFIKHLKYNTSYPKIIIRTLGLAMVFLTLNIILSLFNYNKSFIVVTFVIGFTETIITGYYFFEVARLTKESE